MNAWIRWIDEMKGMNDDLEVEEVIRKGFGNGG